MVYKKKYSISCQISRSKTRYIVFQHKLLFNLVKDLFKWVEGLGRSVMVWVQSERERISDLDGIQKKVLDTLSNFALKTRYVVFQHKLLFNLVKDLFKCIEGLGRSATVRVPSERERVFDLDCKQKSTRYIVKFRTQKLFI